MLETCKHLYSLLSVHSACTDLQLKCLWDERTRLLIAGVQFVTVQRQQKMRWTSLQVGTLSESLLMAPQSEACWHPPCSTHMVVCVCFC